MDKVYPPVAFHFRLSLNNASSATDASFNEVSGISMEMDTEEIAEGGNNNFKHRVPNSVKYTNLVLKRGMIPTDSLLAAWCMETFNDGLASYIKPKTINLTLLNENSLPLKAWKFVNAWPVKWTVADLNSMNNEILIESLEFAYSYFEVVGI